MAVERVEIKKFDGKDDFSLQKKAHTILINPLKLLAIVIAQDKEDMELAGYGTLILNLSVSVLKKIIDLNTQTYKI